MPQSLPLQVLESLQRVTDAALAYLDEDELLDELLKRVAEILEVDTVAILLLEGDQLHARAAKGIEEEVEQGVTIPLGRGFAGRVAAERRPITIFDVDHADIYNPILREKGIKSLLGVPLLVQGRVIGVLHVGSLTPREFHGDDRDLLQLAADRAALAIAQAQLYTRERDAREAAELITRQLRAVQKVTDATLAYLPEEELLQELLQRVSDILAVDTVAILLLEGDRLHARAAKGIEEEVEQGVRIPLGRGFAGRIAAEQRRDHDRRRRPRRHPQPDPAREGHQVPARRPAARPGPRHRRPARRQPHPACVRRRRARSAAAGRRPRRARASSRRALYAQRRVAEAVQQRLLPRRSPTAPGSRARRATCPPPAPASAATGTTCSRSSAAGSRSRSATSSATGSRPPP